MIERSVEFLNELAKDLYKKYWDLELDIPITYEPRGFNWLARHFTENVRGEIKGKKIAITKIVIENFTDEGLIDVLKHELCHHACLTLNKDSHDGSDFFESELKRIDACSNYDPYYKMKQKGYIIRKNNKMKLVKRGN